MKRTCTGNVAVGAPSSMARKAEELDSLMFDVQKIVTQNANLAPMGVILKQVLDRIELTKQAIEE